VYCDPLKDILVKQHARAQQQCPSIIQKLARFGYRFKDVSRTISLSTVEVRIVQANPLRVWLEIFFNHQYDVEWRIISPRGTSNFNRTIRYPHYPWMLHLDENGPMVQWEHRARLPFSPAGGTAVISEVLYVS